METCAVCGSALRAIACIADPAVIEKILTHLDAKTATADASHRPPCRTPPSAAGWIAMRDVTPTVGQGNAWNSCRGALCERRLPASGNPLEARISSEPKGALTLDKPPTRPSTCG